MPDKPERANCTANVAIQRFLEAATGQSVNGQDRDGAEVFPQGLGYGRGELEPALSANRLLRCRLHAFSFYSDDFQMAGPDGNRVGIGFFDALHGADKLQSGRADAFKSDQE